MSTSTILIIAIGIILVAIVYLYNRLIVLRNRVENAWAQIDVQLKRRYDLIPNLVETVKAFAAHEKEVFTNIAKARNMAIQATSVDQQGKAENELNRALKGLFAVAESYPQLKSNQNFLMLQEELAGTESKIAFSRQFYNDSVMLYNTKTQMFPLNVLANIFGFKKKDYLEIEGLERGPVSVNLTP